MDAHPELIDEKLQPARAQLEQALANNPRRAQPDLRGLNEAEIIMVNRAHALALQFSREVCDWFDRGFSFTSVACAYSALCQTLAVNAPSAILPTKKPMNLGLVAMEHICERATEEWGSAKRRS